MAAETAETRSLSEVVKEISSTKGWGSKDEEVLSNATVDEYYLFFKSEVSEHLAAYIDTCLQFGRFADASERQKRIAAHAIEALKLIATESRLNEIRVKRFGILLDRPKAESEEMPNQ